MPTMPPTIAPAATPPSTPVVVPMLLLFPTTAPVTPPMAAPVPAALAVGEGATEPHPERPRTASARTEQQIFWEREEDMGRKKKEARNEISRRWVGLFSQCTRSF